MRTIAVAAAASGLTPIAPAAAARINFPNGLSATLYTAQDLNARLTTFQGSPAIQLEDGRFVPVVTDVGDPSIYNKGDGSFHPFTRELVEHVLGSIEHPRLDLAVRVYMLPYPRRNVLVSSTSGNELFLSPHMLAIDPSVGAYIIAHELGHAFHNHFMPAGSDRWTEYRLLRGIGDGRKYFDTAVHANRPKEILAEDFRVLFGGPEAFFDGRVENTEIALPTGIGGLEGFFLRAAAGGVRGARIDVSSFPNPFNPETEIRIAVSSDLAERGGRVSIRVYSVTGALVRNLHQGVAAGDMLVRWDGRDDSGNRVASSTYYAAIEVGEARETLKLVLLK